MKSRRSHPMAAGLSRYIDEISAAPRLTAEEEHALFQGWHERGDEAWADRCAKFLAWAESRRDPSRAHPPGGWDVVHPWACAEVLSR